MNEKKHIVFLLVVLAAIVGTGALFLANNSAEDVLQSNGTKHAVTQEGVSPDTLYEELTFPDNTLDTSDWETYRNEEFGFEVRYPKGWGIRGGNSPSGGLFTFYHSRREGADNGIYIEVNYDMVEIGELTYNPDYYTKVSVNNAYGYFASQGIPRTRFLERGIVLKNMETKSNSAYSMYVFNDPQNPGDLHYNDVFEQILLSFKLIK